MAGPGKAQRRFPLLAFLITGGLMVAALVAASLLGRLLTRSYHGTVYPDPQPLPDFALPRAGGGTFRLSDQRGQVLAFFFGYTHCPDVCPTTLADLKRAVEQLGADAAGVEVVFVTVDPQRDTPQRVSEYLNRFNPDFIGLVGQQAEIEPVMESFGAAAFIEEGSESSAGYLVTHTASVFGVDRAGRLRLLWSYGTPPEDIAADLRLLLEENA